MLHIAGAASASSASAGTVEVAHEARMRIDDQHALALSECRAVGLQAAIEAEELAVLTIGLGINGRRLGVAFTADLGRVALGVGHQHLALPVGVGTNLLASFLAGGAQ